MRKVTEIEPNLTWCQDPKNKNLKPIKLFRKSEEKKPKIRKSEPNKPTSEPQNFFTTNLQPSEIDFQTPHGDD